MRYVEFAHPGLRCSVLGFGCANLMGRVSRRQSLRALAAAWDQGITVFDSARSYGWGDSEAVLGEFARGRRTGMVVITKFGILPPPRNRLRRLLRPVVRNLLGVAKRYRLTTVTNAVRGQIHQRLTPLVQHGRFDIETARASLHASLKALRTDFVDVLLLHGPQYDDIADGKLIRYLEEVTRAGKARAIGVAADADNAKRIVEAFPWIRIVQIDNNLLNPRIDALNSNDRLAVITNNPFGGQSLIDRLAAVATTASPTVKRWCEQTGIDIRSSRGRAQLLLTYALAANSSGVVLCGMHQAAHIAANAALAAAVPPSHDGFWQVVDQIRRTLQQPEAGGLAADN